MRNFLKEFQAFISKGNVMDLAVAVIIGAAFSNIVNSLVKDIVNPILGVLVGRPDFTNLFVVLKPVEGYVASQTALVKHIPVLAVPADSPRNITGIADLTSAERVLIGDPESTPIGKIAKKLEAAGLIKCLRKGNVQRKNNAVWLLTIGTPEENAEVEAYVRQHMYL